MPLRFPPARRMQCLDLMGAKKVTELAAWQRADELRQFVHEITGRGPVARDYKFKDQIRDAADGATRNVAEGFGRYGHREFARFVTVGIGCVDEVNDCRRAGRLRSVFTEEICEQGQSKAGRAAQ